jgi:2-deoxy-D-gluconate 3-dehydrogenase
MSASFRLDGRTALVTGATAGLGGAMALALAEAGADVVVHDRADPPVATAAAIQALGRRAATVCGDMGDPKSPAAIVRDAEAALGPIDILINNAGTIRRAPAAEHSDEDWISCWRSISRARSA